MRGSFWERCRRWIQWLCSLTQEMRSSEIWCWWLPSPRPLCTRQNLQHFRFHWEMVYNEWLESNFWYFRLPVTWVSCGIRKTRREFVMAGANSRYRLFNSIHHAEIHAGSITARGTLQSWKWVPTLSRWLVSLSPLILFFMHFFCATYCMCVTDSLCCTFLVVHCLWSTILIWFILKLQPIISALRAYTLLSNYMIHRPHNLMLQIGCSDWWALLWVFHFNNFLMRQL